VEELQPLRSQLIDEEIDAGRVPPGAAKAGDKTEADRSPPIPNTIGIVVVAFLAATAAGVLLGIAMTVTFRCTKSAAKSGNRSY
jgi:hypothetical protein